MRCADRFVILKTGADSYSSVIGHLDPRCELYVDTSEAGKAESTRADTLVFPDEDIGSRRTADVCVMAAKLSYENPAVVQRVVEQCWNMHFVKFFNCWNGENNESRIVLEQQITAIEGCCLINY